MSFSATAPADSTTSGKAYYRFYNSHLTAVYKSSVLSTVTASAASHMISSSSFSQSTELKSKRKITINTPPSRSWPRTSSLSSPFLALVSTAAVPAKPAKRPRVQPPKALQPAEPAVPAEPQELESVEEEPRKRKTPFKRTAALDGQLRTFKVLMRPRALQIKELKLCFSVARLRYNQTNALIKGGAPRNKVKLRNEVLAMPQPEWADGKLKVARSMQDSAVAQSVAAYSTNEAKKKKNPGYQHEIKYRSLKKNYT